MSNKIRKFLWSIPLPLFVFGNSLLAASAMIYDWTDADRLLTILLLLPIPLYLILERVLPKRREWLLNWKNFGKDLFWISATYLIWVPIYDEHYDTPISDWFTSLSAASNVGYRFESETLFGLIGVSLLATFIIEFIGYWLHRLQHRFMFFWRIHATHHHISKMSVTRTDRTHPLEFLGLNLGSAVVLGYFGASGDVVGLTLLIRMSIAYSCHCNLPMTSGIFGWVFNTPEWHQVHHSCNYAESNTNFGCSLIIWDRIFGTFKNKEMVEKIGNGSGNPLSLITQLSIPFRSNKAIRKL